MDQLLEVKVTIPVKIPGDKILVDKVEYQNLKNESAYGKNVKLPIFSEITGKSESWIKKHWLSNKDFIRTYGVDNNGFIYPTNGEVGGGIWLFRLSGAKSFVENEMSFWVKGEIK